MKKIFINLMIFITSFLFIFHIVPDAANEELKLLLCSLASIGVVFIVVFAINLIRSPAIIYQSQNVEISKLKKSLLAKNEQLELIESLNVLYKEGKSFGGKKTLSHHDNNNNEIWGYKIEYKNFESRLSIWTEKTTKILPKKHKFEFENPFKVLDHYSPKHRPFRIYEKRMEILYSVIQGYNEIKGS